MFDIKHIYQDPVSATLAVVAVAGGAAAYDQQKAAGRDQRRSRNLQRKLQDVKTQREKRQAVRSARAARAELVSGAQAAGTSATSSSQSGVGNIGTQLASNLSFLDQSTALTDRISVFEQRAADDLRRAGTSQAISQTTLQAGSLFV